MSMAANSPYGPLAQVSPELAEVFHKMGVRPIEEGSASGIGGGIERGVNRMASAWKNRQWDEWRMNANAQRQDAERGAYNAATAAPPASPASVSTASAPVAPTTSRPALAAPSMATTPPPQFSQSGTPYEQQPPSAVMSPTPWATPRPGMASAPPQSRPSMAGTHPSQATGPEVPAPRPFVQASTAQTGQPAVSGIQPTFSSALDATDPRIRAHMDAVSKFDPASANKMVRGMMEPYVDQGAMIGLQAKAGAEQRARDMHGPELQMKMAQAQQLKMQTPEWRAENAERFGLQKGTPDYNQFVISGTYSPKDDIVKQKEDEQLWQRVRKPDGSYEFRAIGGTENGDPQQRTCNKAFAKEQAPKLHAEATKAFQDATGTIRTIDDMAALSQFASTGWGAGGLNEARRMASRLGIAPESFANATTATETFRALTQKFVLSEGQKLKPMSNTDVAFVEKGLATIYSDPSTLPVLLPALKAEAQRSALANRLAAERYLSRGQPVDAAAIEAEVDARIPSVIRQIYGYGGQQVGQQAPPATQGQDDPVRVQTPDEAMRLPPGTPILLPDGTRGRVPGQAAAAPQSPGARPTAAGGGVLMMPTGR